MQNTSANRRRAAAAGTPSPLVQQDRFTGRPSTLVVRIPGDLTGDQVDEAIAAVMVALARIGWDATVDEEDV